jgi:two-component system OmpR family response regulator
MYRKTILVVDDQPHSRAFIRAVLERQGCRILEADNHASASAVIQRAGDEVSLALIDVEADGRPEVLPTVQDVPVLFMSRHERARLVAEGRVEPSDEILAKPLTVRSLIAAIASRFSDTTEAARRQSF